MEAAEKPAWHQPDTYSVWAYDRGNDTEPILLLAQEWETGGLRGVRVLYVWLPQDEPHHAWESHPEFDEVQGFLDNAEEFASLVENNKVHRIGPMPPIGQRRNSDAP